MRFVQFAGLFDKYIGQYIPHRVKTVSYKIFVIPGTLTFFFELFIFRKQNVLSELT